MVTEKQFQATVVEMAEAFGWMVYHQVDMGFTDAEGKHHHSRRIGPGFPDLVLCHPERGALIFAELKADKGRLASNQKVWFDALSKAHPWTYVWRPKDWHEIEKALRGD